MNKSTLQSYRIDEEIGRGASGICYKVENIINHKTYVMKKININSLKHLNPKQICNEVAILSKVKHPNIIQYEHSFTQGAYLYIIMQYANRGDLHAVLLNKIQILKRKKFKKQYYLEIQIWRMCTELLKAVEYLHSHRIIHRDIKTLNIFLNSNGTIILGDLGVSKLIKSDITALYSRVGTPLYLPPEIIKYQKYDYKADIWGVGCVAYLITSLVHPFQGKNLLDLAQNIVNNQPKPILGYSSKLNSFIFSMLNKKPELRPNPTQLLQKYCSDVKISEKVVNISQKFIKKLNNNNDDSIYCFKRNNIHKIKNDSINQSIITNNFIQPKVEQELKIQKKDEPIKLIHFSNKINHKLNSTIFKQNNYENRMINDEITQQCKQSKNTIKNRPYSTSNAFIKIAINQPEKQKIQEVNQSQREIKSDFIDIHKLSYEKPLKERPKSSIYRKQKNNNKYQVLKYHRCHKLSTDSKKNFNSMIETRYLNKPQIVIL